MIRLTECLLASGAEVNALEGSGATPLLTAVLTKRCDMVQLLLKYGARPDGTFPGTVPSPLQAAQFMEIEEIVGLLSRVVSETDSLNKIFKKELLGVSSDETSNPLCSEIETCLDDKLPTSGETPQVMGGRDTVISIGDVKTTVTTRGLKTRCPDEFGKFSETPGDFHCIAYCMESIAALYGPGGFYYIASHVLKRLKVTPESFQHAFKEENYERNFEFLRDMFFGLVMAFFHEFKKSEFFPSADCMADWLKTHQELNTLLMRLKDWKQEMSKDSTFKYYSDFVLFYGPLLLVYQEAVRNCQGSVREACWMQLLPIFAALNKKNYRDEAFVHIVNFSALWPLALRQMFRKNCAVSLKGGASGHCVALDEFVEMCLVKPLKVYAKKQTTVAMLQKVNMNIQLFEHVRNVYKRGFDLHHTSRHSRPDSMPDRITVEWFAIKEGWFQDKGRDCVLSYPRAHKEVPEIRNKLATKLLNPKETGYKYLKDHFKEMLLRLFPNIDC